MIGRRGFFSQEALGLHMALHQLALLVWLFGGWWLREVSQAAPQAGIVVTWLHLAALIAGRYWCRGPLWYLGRWLALRHKAETDRAMQPWE